jgi:hypothetical protein
VTYPGLRASGRVLSTCGKVSGLKYVSRRRSMASAARSSKTSYVSPKASSFLPYLPKRTRLSRKDMKDFLKRA